MKKISILIAAMLLVSVAFAQVAAKNSVVAPKPLIEKGAKGVLLEQDFEGTFPPSGWTVTNYHADPTCNWHQDDDGTGNLVAQCLYVDANMMDEWLITPSIDLSVQSGVTLTFWFATSYYWHVTMSGAAVFVKISTDGGTTWDPEWVEADYGTFENWEWYQASIPLTAYEGQADVKIAFNYVGDDGAQFMLDDVVVTETTSINESDISLNIYPNPASDFVVLTQYADVDVFNVYGQIIGTYTNVNGIDVSSFDNGMYIFRIRMGESVISKNISIVR